MPINQLSCISSPWKRYVVIGGGKTGIDAILYLMKNSVNPDRVWWIIPNDPWLLNRDLGLVDNLATGMRHDVFKFIESENYNQLVSKWEVIFL